MLKDGRTGLWRRSRRWLKLLRKRSQPKPRRMRIESGINRRILNFLRAEMLYMLGEQWPGHCDKVKEKSCATAMDQIPAAERQKTETDFSSLFAFSPSLIELPD